jgi:WD40 repeat protein
MIKGGFWDGRLEINSIINGPKEEPYSTCIFPSCGPIIIMAMPKNEQILICGTKLGVIIAFEVYDKNIQLKQKLFLYNDEITSISINDNLNMFASASKDGYIMLNTLPTLELVRAFKLNLNNNKKKFNNLYANNVFLSSCPIPVIVIYCSEAKIFKTYSINGLFMNEQEEEDYTEKIECYYIYNNLDFQEFLIYGTDDGLVKIRKFPEMTFIKSVNPFDGAPIQTLTLSQDKRYCYVWGKENQIGLIKDNSISNDDKKEDNFGRLGYIQK